MKIVRGDTVIVISGDEKGKIGKVLAVFPETQRVIVEKVNMVKRHTRPVTANQMQGGIIEKEAPIHVSNVALYDSKAKGPTRVRFRIREETVGNETVKIKERISAKTGEVIEKPERKK